jgi:hypothetical protein
VLNRVLEAKVAMFDTKDPKDPSQVDKSTMAVSGSWMILQLDCEPDQRVAIPLQTGNMASRERQLHAV